MNTLAVPMEHPKQKRKAIKARVMRLINEVAASLHWKNASAEEQKHLLGCLPPIQSKLAGAHKEREAFVLRDDGDDEMVRCIECSDRIVTAETRMRLIVNAFQPLNIDETFLQQYAIDPKSTGEAAEPEPSRM